MEACREFEAGRVVGLVLPIQDQFRGEEELGDGNRGVSP